MAGISGSVDKNCASHSIGANNLTRSETADLNGDGLVDQRSSATTARNAAGTTTITETTSARDNSLVGRTVTTVTADGLSKTVASDVTGDGVGIVALVWPEA